MLASTLQATLLFECLFRRVLLLPFPAQRPSVQRFADFSVVTTAVAALLQALTLPFQLLLALIATANRYVVLVVVGFSLYALLAVSAQNSVYIFAIVVRFYNIGVAPVAGVMQYAFIVADFVYRAVVPLTNGLSFLGTQLLTRIVVPFSFHSSSAVPEIMQALALAVGAIGQSFWTWLQAVMACTVDHRVQLRCCGLNGATQCFQAGGVFFSDAGFARLEAFMAASNLTFANTTIENCASVFVRVDTRCYATPGELSVDLLTPGLFMRQTAAIVQDTIASHCGLAALVLNLAMFPLADHQLYIAIHGAVNTVLYTLVGLPISTVRRCEMVSAEAQAGVFTGVQRLVACTPDWKPVAELATSAATAAGRAIDNWLNAVAALVQHKITGKMPQCTDRQELRMRVLVEDAAKAMHFHEQIRELAPELDGPFRTNSKAQPAALPTESLSRVRVVGMTRGLLGVSDGETVVYRSAHDGYVYAYGAWPYRVDVRYGMAAVTFSGAGAQQASADPSGETRAGLLGCRCEDLGTTGIRLHCATAPYVEHVDDDLAGFNATAAHEVDFVGLDLQGMTCANTLVRVQALRWPRKRVAAGAEHGGFAGYNRGGANFGRLWKGDADAQDLLRMHGDTQDARQHSRSGAVEAAVYVQPVCSESNQNQLSLACARVAVDNCFPWCMGTVRAGQRGQRIVMYSAAQWNAHVIAPDLDCAVSRDRGACALQEGAVGSVLVDFMRTAAADSRRTVGRCDARSMCAQTAPGTATSILRIRELAAQDALGVPAAVEAHKNGTAQVYGGVRQRSQPFAIAGDVLLGVSQTGDNLLNPNQTVVTVTRLYDIGQGALSMATERLTLIDNAHAVRVATCPTIGDSGYVARAASAGHVVLPAAFSQQASGVEIQSAGGLGPVPLARPATASKWAVHWAVNPALEVYTTFFDFCAGRSSFTLEVQSNYGRARVWTMHATRSVDIETGGTPNDAEIRSRVAYMLVPDFFEPDRNRVACDAVVGLRVVGVEYLNEQNILLSVLAGRPRDYDARLGDLVPGATRSYRYYLLHPQRHDCVEPSEGDSAEFSCWRREEDGLWPDDSTLTTGSWGQDAGLSEICANAQLIPAFGSNLVLPLVAWIAVVEVSLDSLCTMTAAMFATRTDVERASAPSPVADLMTAQLSRPSFHSMVDGAGARLLNGDDVIAAAGLMARFTAHLLISVVNAFVDPLEAIGVAGGATQHTRMVVVGTAKILEGNRADGQPFETIENMFRGPIVASASRSSLAVLTLTDGYQSMPVMPALMLGMINMQLQMVGQLSMILTVGRRVLLQLALVSNDDRATRAVVHSAVTTALLDAQPDIRALWLDTMRFQCYGLAQLAGGDFAWAETLKQTCLVLPDTLDGVLQVVHVLVGEYPVVTCVCKAAQGEAQYTSGGVMDYVGQKCLQHYMPLEWQQWVLEMAFLPHTRQQACIQGIDGAHDRLRTAFDPAFNRVYKAGRHAAEIFDDMLSLMLNDGGQCFAFDVSPYVISMIPEPVDYFMQCMHTADCGVRCLEEYRVFEEARAAVMNGLAPDTTLGYEQDWMLPLTQQLFSTMDVEEDRHLAPFELLDMVELNIAACMQVCARGEQSADSVFLNRCVAVTGRLPLQTKPDAADFLLTRVQSAYYCLPQDITESVREWNYPSFTYPRLNEYTAVGGTGDNLLGLLFVTNWAAQEQMRDMLLALVQYTAPSADNAKELQLLVPGQPARVLLRTSGRTHSKAQEDSSLSQEWLQDVRAVEVDVADEKTTDPVIYVYGWRLQCDTTVSSDGKFRSCSTVAACLRGQIEGNPSNMDYTTSEATGTRPLVQWSRCEAGAGPLWESSDFDRAGVYHHICLRERRTWNAAQGLQTPGSTCMERLSLPIVRQLDLDSDSMPTKYGYSQEERPELLVRMLDATGDVHTHRLQMSEASLAALGSDEGARLYEDAGSGIYLRSALLSSVLYISEDDLASLRRIAVNSREAFDVDLLVANARDNGAWLHVLSLDLGAGQVRGREGLRTETVLRMNMSCSVDNCGACGHAVNVNGTSVRSSQLTFRALENACFAAQLCGLERCVGTLVNMRRPLCNLGSVMVSEVEQARIVAHGLWTGVADTIGASVELSEVRRLRLELKWPEETLQGMTCALKDVTFSLSATITSVVGALSHLMQQASVFSGFVGSAIDAREHARFIMVLMSTTNFLASILMAGVYEIIVAVKLVACTVNDVSLIVSDFIRPFVGTPALQIQFGSQAHQAAVADAEIYVCLDEGVRRELFDASTGFGPQQSASANVLSRLAVFVTDTRDAFVRYSLQYAYKAFDVTLTWVGGILRAIMDLAQTLDWENCKLPVVNSGLELAGLCVCGDEPYRIVSNDQNRQIRNGGVRDGALWCSGLLLMTAGDGEDLIVWNPFSLEQLLSKRGADGSTFDQYIACLGTSGICEEKKPEAPELERQGVEVAQVVSRCRANYQQKRWDEASPLYSLFWRENWQSLTDLQETSRSVDDRYTSMRRHIVRTMIRALGEDSAVNLPLTELEYSCLRDALHAGPLAHNCHAVSRKERFVYEPVTEAPSVSRIDACRVFSGPNISDTNDLELAMPRFLWSGNSANRVPVATLHAFEQPDAARFATAQVKLEALLSEVDAVFASMTEDQFRDDLMHHLRVAAFSTEGDELHQLLDCVILGPYAAADFGVNVHSPKFPALPVPQYHRGRADSREFESWGSTGGSEVRRHLVSGVLDYVEEEAQSVVASVAVLHLRMLESMWTLDNVLCQCLDNTRSLECCTSFDNASAITFDAQYAFERTTWDVAPQVLDETWQRVLMSDALSKWPWVEFTPDPVTLTPTQRAEMARLHMFDNDRPVRSYTIDDTPAVLGNETLWRSCTNAVASLYALLPLQPPSQSDAADSPETARVNIPDYAFEYDPATDVASERMHAIEAVVERLLRTARRDSPVFWTHANRYVASDSVWCDSKESPQTIDTTHTLQVPSSLYDIQLQHEEITAPSLSDVLFPGKVLALCACNWPSQSAQTSCGIDPTAHGLVDDVQWAHICSDGYSTRDELMYVLAVLRDSERNGTAATWREQCLSARPSATWGLLSPQEQDEWYAGKTQSQNGEWTLDAQHLAVHGPGGLRIGMMVDDSQLDVTGLYEHMKTENLGGSTSGSVNFEHHHTVAQPVCEAGMHEHLRATLDEYFMDTFFPMAHSVLASGPLEYCTRWVLEEALAQTLRMLRQDMSSTDSTEDTLRRFDERVDDQNEVAAVWRDRCLGQMHLVGLCALRGVYDLAPDEFLAPPAQCAFAGPAHVVQGCTRVYYTPSCLVFCDGRFFDPCLCNAGVCEPETFNAETCDLGRLQDGRDLLNNRDSEGFLTSSLHWPESVSLLEAHDSENLTMLTRQLRAARGTESVVDASALFQLAVDHILERKDEETTPQTFCDDLLDYWPDQQHPLGYHPTTSCLINNTNTRGFGSWMSRNASGHVTIEPVRHRNMTSTSLEFGAAHLVCDAYVYDTPGLKPNPYFIHSRWDANAQADPAVPRMPKQSVLTDMQQLGTPSARAAQAIDTPLARARHNAELLLRHSLGLVRDWARWFGIASEAYQADLDSEWPHWIVETGESASHYLPSGDVEEGPPPGCQLPPQSRCQVDAECGDAFRAEDMVCLLNYAEPTEARYGICMQRGTCYQHRHCTPENNENNGNNAVEQLCSADGVCVTAAVSVRNDATFDAAVRFYTDADGIDTRHIGMFQNIPDFAHANGMCTFRNWHHYNNATANAVHTDQLRLVPEDRILQRTDGPAMSLADLNILHAQAHACDRTYEHTEYRLYDASSEQATITLPNGATTAASVLTHTRTRESDEASNASSLRFCDMYGNAVTGFLAPYQTTSATPLREAAMGEQKISRCTAFKMCPVPWFTVHGRSVQTRRVQVVTEVNGELVRQGRTREYCNLDAKRCLGMGYLAGDTCGESETAQCVLDTLVVPLAAIVLGDFQSSKTVETARAELATLRTHCPYAFHDDAAFAVTGGVEERNEFLLIGMHARLTQPYDPEEREMVMRNANALLPILFGTSGKTTSGFRGFDNLDEYHNHVKCATYLSTELYQREQALNAPTVDSEDQVRGVVYQTELLEDPVFAGGGLYLIAEHLPVDVPLRWFVQCVVMAKNDDKSEGGIPENWLLLLNRGEYNDYECANYAGSTDIAPLTLKKRLQTAPFLFTQQKEETLETTQIVDDLDRLIGVAIDEYLGVRAIPDLHCIQPSRDDESVEDIILNGVWYGPGLTRTEFPSLENVADMDLVATRFYLNQNTSIFRKVREFLVKTSNFTYDAESWYKAADLGEFLRTGVVQLRDDANLDTVVQADQTIIPMYAFTRLTDAQVMQQELIPAVHALPDNYVHSEETSAQCITNGNSKARTLTEPEYSLPLRLQCTWLGLLTCPPEVEYLQRSQKFLRQNEVLYLVLLILQLEMSNTASGSIGALRPLTDYALRQLYVHAFENNATNLRLSRAVEYNEHLKQYECGADSDLHWLQETNIQHRRLRECLAHLQEVSAWELPRRRTLRVPVKANALLLGFYPAFMEMTSDSTQFLDGLTKDLSTEADASFNTALCADGPNGVQVLSPFWAEYFDVGYADSIGCDMTLNNRDAQGGSNLYYDTLCEGLESSCNAHPSYRTVLENQMSQECQRRDSQDVTRKHLGSQAFGRTPLCDRRPDVPTTCSRRFGTLNGRQGRQPNTLANIIPDLVRPQIGLWSNANVITRGEAYGSGNADEVLAFRMHDTDIGGHDLEFRIRETGESAVLELSHVHLRSRDSDAARPASVWLRSVEEHWSWTHAVEARYWPTQDDQNDPADVSWTCPLYWLKRYQDDGASDQVRSPSRHRNAERFRHITGRHEFAHPALEGSRKVGGLRAAHFVSETIACAGDVTECHAKALLQETLQVLVRKDWTVVQHYPPLNYSTECARYLDWPHEPYTLLDEL